MKRKINVGIRCSRCGKIVPYNFNNFVNVGDEPVCNTCIDGGSTMTTYLNSLKKSNAPEKKKEEQKEIQCKYKFYDKEKFNGDEYCTLFHEKCMFLMEAGICDCNCQVYEDYKQLSKCKQTLIDIEGLCTTTTANVLMYQDERTYSYKAIVEHNDKIKKKIKEILK